MYIENICKLIIYITSPSKLEYIRVSLFVIFSCYCILLSCALLSSLIALLLSCWSAEALWSGLALGWCWVPSAGLVVLSGLALLWRRSKAVSCHPIDFRDRPMIIWLNMISAIALLRAGVCGWSSLLCSHGAHHPRDISDQNFHQNVKNLCFHNFSNAVKKPFKNAPAPPKRVEKHSKDIPRIVFSSCV